MTQLKDPTIKLFGKTIPYSIGDVLDGDESGGGSSSDNDRASSAGSEIGVKLKKKKVSQGQTAQGHKQQGEDESVNGNVTLGTNENQKIPSLNEEIENVDAESSNITNEMNSNEKAPLNKPDKVLPCPRCNSMDTKFCYYNNYNVLQPRHFCKGCQRYWTAGGAMRNIPVGAGRRKSKNAALQSRYLTSSEIFLASGAGSPNEIVTGHPGLKCGSVLFTVDSDATVSASTGSVSNLTPMPFLDNARNPSHTVNDRVVTKSHRIGEINSSSSCVTASIETGSNQHGCTSLAPRFNGGTAQILCIPAWPYPWNSAIPPAPFPHPGIAFPFVPPNYWPCIPNALNAPRLTPLAPLQTANTIVEGIPNSIPSLLGKHSIDDEVLPKDRSEKPEAPRQPSVLIPKMLRVGHPEEAAKSSIWETLGIKKEILSKGGIFSDLKSKELDKIKHVPENYAHLSSNPAALSRSLNFQEVS